MPSHPVQIKMHAVQTVPVLQRTERQVVDKS